jgi:hypothetical protein
LRVLGTSRLFEMLAAVSAVREPMRSVLLPYEEFAEDANSRLGRANGNTYQRRPGVDNVHDGQIMVRLKKKRFIILDYGYSPNNNDHAIARNIPHISIPHGAGQTRCATKDCSRVGVPVLLYDSEPHEPMSLYLRGGLCFSCQRNLNEKRRTQRKRKVDEQPSNEVPINEDIPIIRSGSASCCKFKTNDQIVELNPDAIVINGPVNGTRTRGSDYRCHEIGTDVLRIVSELSQETQSLVEQSSGAQQSTDSINNLYQRAFLSASRVTYLLTQWKSSYDAQHQQQKQQKQQADNATTPSAHFDSRILDEAVARTETALSLNHHRPMEQIRTRVIYPPFPGGRVIYPPFPVPRDIGGGLPNSREIPSDTMQETKYGNITRHQI